MEIRKDNPMSTNPISPKEKKLRNLRNILWIVFAAIAITILLVGSLSLPAAMLINKTTSFSSLFGSETGMILLSLGGHRARQDRRQRDHLRGDLQHLQIPPGKG